MIVAYAVKALRISVASLLLLIAGCGAAVEDTNAELRAWVADAEAAAEDKDRRRLLSKVSERYADARGNERDDLSNIVRALMLRQRSVELLTKIDGIESMGTSAANIELTVAMAGTQANRFGVDADAYRFELELERQDGDWQLIGARWGELGSDVH